MLDAFELCDLPSLKVVLIGQDPYHGPGQQNGLCFSVNTGIRIPPSLKNIFKELQSDIPRFYASRLRKPSRLGQTRNSPAQCGTSVETGKPGSHKAFGWEQFTDSLISLLGQEKENLVFLLWGNYAIGKSPLINQQTLVLTAAHPSPLARGAFFGCKHFSKTNNYLVFQRFKSD